MVEGSEALSAFAWALIGYAWGPLLVNAAAKTLVCLHALLDVVYAKPRAQDGPHGHGCRCLRRECQETHGAVRFAIKSIACHDCTTRFGDGRQSLFSYAEPVLFEPQKPVRCPRCGCQKVLFSLSPIVN